MAKKKLLRPGIEPGTLQYVWFSAAAGKSGYFDFVQQLGEKTRKRRPMRVSPPRYEGGTRFSLRSNLVVSPPRELYLCSFWPNLTKSAFSQTRYSLLEKKWKRRPFLDGFRIELMIRIPNFEMLYWRRPKIILFGNPCSGKIRKNVAVLDLLDVVNFDFTRKIVKKNWMKNSWKCWGVVKIEFFDKNLTFRIVWNRNDFRYIAKY